MKEDERLERLHCLCLGPFLAANLPVLARGKWLEPSVDSDSILATVKHVPRKHSCECQRGLHSLSVTAINVGGASKEDRRVGLSFSDEVESFYLKKKKDLCFLMLVSLEMKSFLHCQLKLHSRN